MQNATKSSFDSTGVWTISAPFQALFEPIRQNARSSPHGMDLQRRMYAYDWFASSTQSLSRHAASRMDSNLTAHCVRTQLLSIQGNLYTATRTSNFVGDEEFYGFKDDGHGYHFFPSREGRTVPGKRVPLEAVAQNVPQKFRPLFVEVSRLLQSGFASAESLSGDSSALRPVLEKALPLVEELKRGIVELPRHALSRH